MRVEHKTLMRASAVIVMAASIAACSTKPKPMPEPTVPPPPPPAQQIGPPRPAPPPVSQAPLPGSVQDFVVNVGERIYFDFDSYTLRDDARPILDAQAAWLVRYPAVTVRLEGNADERGTREYNFALGARRANSVRDYLVGRGVAAQRIETVSYGKERPLDPGTSEEAYQANRNVRTGITGGSR